MLSHLHRTTTARERTVFEFRPYGRITVIPPNTSPRSAFAGWGMVDLSPTRYLMNIPAKWTPCLLSAVRIVVGLLFFQHGAEKLWGFAGGRIDRDFASLRGMAGPIEVVGGGLIVLGLFTRTTAFILCGEMAVAYFRSWAPRGFWPINNGGEEAVLCCYIFLWLVTAGPGSFGLDAVLQRKRHYHSMKEKIALWEPQARSVLRIVLAFVFILHGFRNLFGFFPALAGRRGAVPMALDALPPLFGTLELAGGALLFFGLFTRPAAVVLAVQLAAAYWYSAVPRGGWPIRNGGNEVLFYFLVFAYLAADGAGVWSLDELFQSKPGGRN